MKKLLLPLFTLIFFTVFTSSVHASSLQVSKNSSFSSSDLNFSGGDKVYIKVDSDGSGSSLKVLNIRDNTYKLISSVDLTKSGNQFSASFSAPDSQGYYSLEAVIEGDGQSSKSVKTIKVGSPTSANINVKVSSNVKGEKVTSVSNESEVSKAEEVENNANPTPEVFTSENNSPTQVTPAKTSWFFAIVQNVFSFFWPFK